MLLITCSKDVEARFSHCIVPRIVSRNALCASYSGHLQSSKMTILNNFEIESGSWKQQVTVSMRQMASELITKFI